MSYYDVIGWGFAAIVVASAAVIVILAAKAIYEELK